MSRSDSTHDGRSGAGGFCESILVVEDSRALSTALSYRFATELGLNVVVCPSMKTLEDALAAPDRNYVIAVVGLNMPDSFNGEALDLAIDRGVPTVVFTGSFDLDLRQRMISRRVVDYVVKDSEFAIDDVVSSVRRALQNRHIRVLAVDDIASARSMLVDLLQAQLFQVFEAATGAEALHILERHPDIELVVTDYHMPDMNGYELTRTIRRRHNSDRMRIIGISASTDRLLSASFLKAGASDFVYRPFMVEELQCRISHNIETLKQIKELRIAAAYDYLTGLVNRRFFYDQSPQRIEQCLKAGLPCSVGILDIDHFKRLNDTYGHETGDRMLKAVATKLAALIPAGGHILARLGGEEFGLLLLGMDSREATDFCQKLREAAASAGVATEEADISVTISIGTAEVCGRETFDNYLNAADQFLYMAKGRGRNQVYSDYVMALESASAIAS